MRTDIDFVDFDPDKTRTGNCAGIKGAVLSGNDEAAGIIVVTSQVNKVTTRETGGFVLYCPVP